ncbi:CLUMA_CG011278, isoform A [Clunio marinus]|uniref:CLUMA_CG011278, isoform A n=1 Tax=Clunio marinus TaxID=568069 RepID=A0A1J1IC84_9DIPT|nr:CLUMA_CG011278, isoform A [Clunio marinus]
MENSLKNEQNEESKKILINELRLRREKYAFHLVKRYHQKLPFDYSRHPQVPLLSPSERKKNKNCTRQNEWFDN